MWHSSRDMRHVILNWSNLEIYFPKSTPSAQSLFWKSSLIKNHKTWCKKIWFIQSITFWYFMNTINNLTWPNLISPNLNRFYLNLSQLEPNISDWNQNWPEFHQTWPDFTKTRIDMNWTWPIFTHFKPIWTPHKASFYH